MEFRRSGTADERRRKMLVDESTAERMLSPVDRSAHEHRQEERRHRTGVRRGRARRNRKRVADLIPTRPLGVVVFALLGLCAVAAVELAYTFLPDWHALLASRGSEVLDVTSRGSLAAWLSSVLLGAAALSSLLVYAIRRHKMDDYRGRYRLWLWCAAALLVASVNAVAGLHEMFELAAVKLLGANCSRAGRHGRWRAAGWSCCCSASWYCSMYGDREFLLRRLRLSHCCTGRAPISSSSPHRPRRWRWR